MIAVAESTSAEVSKSRRRSVSRSPRVQAEKSVKVGLYISQESARKLGITATMEGKDRSAIVDESDPATSPKVRRAGQVFPIGRACQRPGGSIGRVAYPA